MPWAPVVLSKEETHALSRVCRPARLGSDLAAAKGSVFVQGVFLARRGLRLGAPCERQRPRHIADRRRRRHELQQERNCRGAASPGQRRSRRLRLRSTKQRREARPCAGFLLFERAQSMFPESAEGSIPMSQYQTALIVGAGSGLSASLARLFSVNGMKIALAARSTEKLAALATETGAKVFACDATQRGEVEKLFNDMEAAFGAPDVVVYNASFRTRGSIVDLEPAGVEKAIAVSAFGGFLVGQ